MSLAPSARSRPARPAPRRTDVPSAFLHPLKGHSGARLVLSQQGGASLVRKTAGRAAQNARLLRQCEKLRRLAVYGLPVPRVLGQGVDDTGCAFYEMEYVPACTLAALCRQGTPLELGPPIAVLRRALTFFALAEGDCLASDAFLAKIADIQQSRTRFPRHGEAIGAMAARLAALDWSGIPASPDHGDCTLENILVSADSRVVLIDCDDGWLSSWWLDAAKLYQDVAGHWCLRDLYRDDPAGQPLLHAAERLRRVRAALDHLFGELQAELLPRLVSLAALHLFRTLPYAQDEAVVGFVLARMAEILPHRD